MKLKLLRGYSENEPKIEIGTLEYVEGMYIWTYSSAKDMYDFHSSFFEVPGLPIGEISKSKELFWFFKDRIPSRKRTDFPKYLKMFGLTEYNEWEFMVASGLKLATDTDEVVEAK